MTNIVAPTPLNQRVWLFIALTIDGSPPWKVKVRISKMMVMVEWTVANKYMVTMIAVQNRICSFDAPGFLAKTKRKYGVGLNKNWILLTKNVERCEDKARVDSFWKSSINWRMGSMWASLPHRLATALKSELPTGWCREVHEMQSLVTCWTYLSVLMLWTWTFRLCRSAMFDSDRSVSSFKVLGRKNVVFKFLLSNESRSRVIFSVMLRASQWCCVAKCLSELSEADQMKATTFAEMSTTYQNEI